MKSLNTMLALLLLLFVSTVNAQAFRPTGPFGDEDEFVRRAVQARYVDYIYLERYLRNEVKASLSAEMSESGERLPDKDMQEIAMFIAQDILRKIALGRYNKTKSSSQQKSTFIHCMVPEPHICTMFNRHAPY